MRNIRFHDIFVRFQPPPRNQPPTAFRFADPGGIARARQADVEYTAPRGVCAACPLRAQCTIGKERTVQRHEQAARVELGRQLARSAEARRDRRRRQHLMEGSFGRAASEHGFKRSRWRRLWRQQIQDWLIAAVQNVKLLLRAGGNKVENGAATVRSALALPHFHSRV